MFRVEVAGRGALACVNSTELFRKHVACVGSTDLFANIGSQFTVASHPQRATWRGRLAALRRRRHGVARAECKEALRNPIAVPRAQRDARADAGVSRTHKRVVHKTNGPWTK